MPEDRDKFAQIAGIDEAGRGSLAGPVVAGAVVLHPDKPIKGLTDSKRLTPKKRAQLFSEIRAKAMAWGIGYATAAEIDEINIHRATLRAMKRAYEAMQFYVEQVFVDGLHCPELPTKCTAIVKGDQLVPAISAASILAKVTRDIEMEHHHETLPQYGFDQHKGYPTVKHIVALKKFGPCILHRRSYRPVRDVIALQRPN